MLRIYSGAFCDP
nr:unnamed protein product [Callosobruchus analis]